MKVQSFCFAVCEETGLIYDPSNHGIWYSKEKLFELKQIIDNGIKAIIDKDIDIEGSNTQIVIDANANAIQYQQPQKKDYDSFCYLAYDSKSQCYKIGCSSNVKARNKTLKNANPYLTITHVCDKGYEMEAKLHRIFNAYKVRGEWFSLNSMHVKMLVDNYGFKTI